MSEVALAAAATAAEQLSPSAIAAIGGGTNTTITDAPSSTSRRLERTTVCLPIVHGSVAFYLGKKAADEFQSHRWTLYLRGPNNEDLSHCVQKVVFQLHASFAQPVREYTHPPYEVTEKGWGEFEAQIRIHWKDPTETTTIVAHAIKLYPPGTPANAAPTDTETPVVSEIYDEVVFTDPNESFFQQLQAVRESPPVETEYSQHKHFAKFSDTDDVHALLEAQKFLHRKLRDAKERLRLVDEDLAEVEADLATNLEQQKQRAATTATAAVATTATAANSATSKPALKTANKHKPGVATTSGPSVSPGVKRAKQK